MALENVSMVLFAAAIAFSSLGTVAGFGGGIFMVPLMILGFSIPPQVAFGVTAAALFPASLLTTVINQRRRTIDYPAFFFLGGPSIAGAAVGAWLSSIVPARPLEIAFAVFLFFIAWKTLQAGDGNHRRFHKGVAVIVGALIGLVAGLFGIGGGILVTPLMMRVFGASPRVASATAVAIIMVTSFVSGLTHYRLGHVDLKYLAPAALGFFGGAVAGIFITKKLKERSHRLVVSVSVFLAGIAVIIHAFKIA